MNDVYTEQLIKKKKSTSQWLLEGILLAVTFFSIYGILHFPIFIFLTAILIAGNVFLYLEFDAEYEYLFVNGELDIDKIMHKSRRRRICTIKLEEIELLAPYGAGELRQYQRARKSDYSSGIPGSYTYVLVVRSGGALRKLIFEPNQTIIDGYARMIPGKIAYRSVK